MKDTLAIVDSCLEDRVVHLSDDDIARYADMRRRGLPFMDAARVLGYKPTVLEAAMLGRNVTPQVQKKLLLAEQSAMADFKLVLLSSIYDAALAGQWRAAKELLEKVLPDEYGPRLAPMPTDMLSVTDCERRAQKAAKDLEALRLKREMV